VRRRVSLSLPTGVLAFLQDVTGQTEHARAVTLYLAGRRRYAGKVSEVYLGNELHLVRWRPEPSDALLLRGVNSKQLIEAVLSDANRHGVTIRLPSRGIW
jgi:hypothetical protein